jgi:hypothetical protein
VNSLQCKCKHVLSLFEIPWWLSVSRRTKSILPKWSTTCPDWGPAFLCDLHSFDSQHYSLNQTY